MDDDEFGTITHNAGLTIITSLVLVLVILWLALRSVRIILAVIVSLAVGLAISAAAGLFLVGAFNLISIAFFTLFVGLGIDFAIQFSVRYRAERHEQPDLPTALRSTAVKAGTPLALAAVAIAVGFASFMPTDYLGLSELGEIAGMGMIIAFLQRHRAAGPVDAAPTTGRIAPDGVCGAGARGSVHGTAPHTDRRDHHFGRGARFATAAFPAVRFQPDSSARSQGRVRRNLSRAEKRSANWSQRDRA